MSYDTLVELHKSNPNPNPNPSPNPNRSPNPNPNPNRNPHRNPNPSPNPHQVEPHKSKAKRLAKTTVVGAISAGKGARHR